MFDRTIRHRGFARRLLEAMGVPAIASVAVAACGGNVVVDQEAGGGAGGTGGTSTTGTTTTTTTTGTTSTTTTTTTTSTTNFCSIPLDQPNYAFVCLPPQPGGCPSIETSWLAPSLAKSVGLCDAITDFTSCCDKDSLTLIECGPDGSSAPECCYVVQTEDNLICGVGRPFVVDGAARTARVRSRADWAANARPDVSSLDDATRSALADVWAREATFEHASVASFARLALELLSVGAPAELVRDAQRAMGDEIRHAELCFALASGYAGAPVGPGPVPIDGALGRTTLAEIAAAAVREGCVGETIAALVALEARDRASDPAVRAAIDAIVDDETEHAAMSWRLVAWAHREGGAEVRAAIADAFSASATPPPEALPPGADPNAFRAHGRPLPEDIRAIAQSALAEVIRPSATALMAS